MLTFLQFISEAISKNIEPISWIHHPNHGVVSSKGPYQHDRMLRDNPELEQHGDDKSFGPPRGYAGINHDKKRLDLDSYPLHTKGHLADAKEVEQHIRKNYNVPKSYKTTLHQHYDGTTHDWTNHEKFKTKNIYTE